MKTYNSQQEVFDAVVQHLLTQKKKAAVAGDKCVMRCMYRTPSQDKCAIGCLIPNELYNAGLENRPVGRLPHQLLREIWPNMGEAGSPEFECNLKFLKCLQRVHDHEEVSDWPKALLRVAPYYELNITVLQELALS